MEWAAYTTKVSDYAYLGVNFASNGAWDSHVKDACVNGKKKLNQLHSVLSNRDINLCASRLLLNGQCALPNGCSYAHICPSCNSDSHKARDCSKTPPNSLFKRPPPQRAQS